MKNIIKIKSNIIIFGVCSYILMFFFGALSFKYQNDNSIIFICSSFLLSNSIIMCVFFENMKRLYKKEKK